MITRTMETKIKSLQRMIERGGTDIFLGGPVFIEGLLEDLEMVKALEEVAPGEAATQPRAEATKTKTVLQ